MNEKWRKIKRIIDANNKPIIVISFREELFDDTLVQCDISQDGNIILRMIKYNKNQINETLDVLPEVYEQFSNKIIDVARAYFGNDWNYSNLIVNYN